MGSYLSEPVTEKVSSDEANDKLKSGASSMQGWRVTQEDAHNCLLDFDVNTSLFAVYDGHGGHEVAVYCSQKLPQYIKNTEAYKNHNFEKALEDAFLGFDATIASRDVVAELKKIADVKEGENESSSSDLEENVKNLYEEATMPLEQVIEKYTSNLKNPILHNLQKDGGKQPGSPYLRARRDVSSNEACSSLGESSGSKSLCIDAAESAVSSSSNAENSTKPSTNLATASTGANPLKPLEENGSLQKPEIHIQLVDSSESDSKDNKTVTDDSTSKNNQIETKADCDQPNQNGEVQMLSEEETPTNVETSQENGEISKKGKGKATAKTKGVPKSPTVNTRPRRNAQQLYSKLLEFESESESEDEEDKTFQGPNEESSSDEENASISIDNDNSEASSDAEEEEDLEEDLDDVEEEEDDCEMDEADLDFARNMREEPGSDSGCTAVVALLHENQLFVANAGDSRCIVCRNGKAVEMSFDHKPEDEKEHERVVKAGGKVTVDGRVNGGLNLSRAIGDHAYKQKKELSDREQMITALPDVRSLTINPGEDEFMVLACDGIWNFMSSQQVVDFVRPRIKESPEKLSQICEEMFEHCLAPDTLGDGTGCDNMTAIIIQFKNNLCKRAAPTDDELESGSLKRVKTDDIVSQSESTA